ncbi:MAG TPA: hypothetical protein VGO93_06440 [Candidatus Xenobia bacterium]
MNSITTSNKIHGLQFRGTASKTGAAENGPEVQDHATISGEVSEVGHKKGLMALAGTAVMAGMAVAGGIGMATPAFAAAPAPQVQVMNQNTVTTDTTDTARTANATPATPNDGQAQQLLSQMPGLKDPSFGGGFSRLFGGKFSPSDAVAKLNKGSEVQAPRNGNANQMDVIKNKQQLAELATMRGIDPQGGVSQGIVHAFQNVERSNGFAANGKSMTAYQAYDSMLHGGTVSIHMGNEWVAVNHPAQVQELNALEGNGQDNPLNSQTSSLLKRMSEQTQGEGLYQNGHRLNAYQYLQAAESNQGGISYNFSGGPYHEPLSVPVAHFGDLGQAAQTAANQHKADAVRPSTSFFNKTMDGLTKQMLQGVQADIQSAQSAIDGGKADVQRFTAAAQAESNAIPGARAAVDQAQGGLNATMPRFSVASQRLQAARANLDAASGVDGAARGTEAGALQANNDANARLQDAKGRIAQAQSVLDNQAPADPDAAPAGNQAPVDPDAKPAPNQAPADPDAATTNSANNVRANALNAKAQAQRDASIAQRDVNSSYDAWQQAHNARLGADAALGSTQGQYDYAAGLYNQADAIRAQAAGILSQAQNNLAGHENALGSDQQAVANAHAQIQSGQAALATAQQLSGQAQKYMTELNGAKGDLDAHRQGLHDAARTMSGSAVNDELRQSLAHQQQLLDDMGKPQAPAGYHEAGPVVISQQ